MDAIETERLHIRNFTADDWKELQEVTVHLEAIMFALALLMLILLPLTFCASALKSWFTPEELNAMGVRLENIHP